MGWRCSKTCGQPKADQEAESRIMLLKATLCLVPRLVEWVLAEAVAVVEVDQTDPTNAVAARKARRKALAAKAKSMPRRPQGHQVLSRLVEDGQA